ncbi:family 16 glycosylhydrolase [Erythrobacter arachoides]|uniref:Family 16 glycosylhydrolase n=1 Tax=Aurantiacibacter arachoides TaxID=1850444 RepID=A0A845A8Q2_9SPHN|nr:glycoside hydrolase family 16 protein [Aurantiacibacter arachoides]MXO93939.1 family 16 glycosylhydrolase [Aurantiacibacter arachoides]GGD45469.1 glycosyl hydrolase family 16 [Aurantiacibacter arachoides]
MRTFPAAIGLLALASLSGCAATLPAPPLGSEGRALVFSDEFDGDTLDRTKWGPVGPDFWVNYEQQAYVDDPRVIRFAQGIAGADGGVLELRPVWAPGEDPNAERSADFLSGRLTSQGKFDFTHGRAEARIRMPDARGVWPAWWALGNEQWPQTGEIDIMEYVGEAGWTAVAVHGPGYSGDTPIVDRYYFEGDTDVTDWHVYAVEWTPEYMSFQIDGRETYRATRAMIEHYGEWRFDTPKHLILNFAMGGAYPHKVNGIDAPYPGIPQETVDRVRAGEADLAMYVDWVRVYAPAR